METDTQTDSTRKNNFDSTTMIYMKEESIKLKNFVQNAKTVNEGKNECKRRIQQFSLKVKQSTNPRDHNLVGFLRIINTKIQNLPNVNFKILAGIQIESIATMSNSLIVGDKFDKEYEMQKQ